MLKKVININNLRHNAKVIKNKAGKRKVCAVIKSDAYGFSIEPTALVLNSLVDLFAVASTSEAIKLQGITNKQILVLTPCEKVTEQKNVTYTVSNLKNIKDVELVAKKQNRRIGVHIKLDTGMNRLGFKNDIEFILAVNYIKNSKNLKLEGIYTHFASSNISNLKKQDKRFRSLLKLVKLPKKCLVHSASSNVLFSKYKTAGNMVRCGIAFYGGINNFNLLPIFKAYAKIVEIKTLNKGDKIGYDYTYTAKKQTKVAIINSGYFDGVNRLISTNKNYFYIQNKRCEVLGRVSMNLTAIDISSIKNVELTDKAYYIRNTIDALKIAKNCNTIVYEVFTNLKNCDIIFVWELYQENLKVN